VFLFSPFALEKEDKKGKLPPFFAFYFSLCVYFSFALQEKDKKSKLPLFFAFFFSLWFFFPYVIFSPFNFEEENTIHFFFRFFVSV
jgi:hypothetical protein